MALLGGTVERGLVLLEADASGELVTVDLRARVALGRCQRCGRRIRVLPCDALPRKTYGLAVIEHEVEQYTRGKLSLREVAWGQLGSRPPAHTTLFGWSEGLGAHALARPGGDAGGAPIGRFMAEAESHLPGAAEAMRREVHPDPRRYRSEPRRERLAALMRIFALVAMVAGVPHPHALAECRRLTLEWSHTSTLVFPSRFSRTAIEHRDRSQSPRSRSPSEGSPDPCLTRARSPPGASSISHP